MLAQRFAKVEAERNELYERFEASIFELQQKTGLRGALLERKLEAAYEVLEKKESQLAEILAASNLDAPTLQNVRTCPLRCQSPTSKSGCMCFEFVTYDCTCY